jgi:hypothetical protein
MANTEILHAYRDLYRGALRAVRNSSPAKHMIRMTIREAFRNSPIEEFESQKIENTKAFLRRAETHAGIEHKILRNLLHVRFWQRVGKTDLKL